MIKANELRLGNWYKFANPMENGVFSMQQVHIHDDFLSFEFYADPIKVTSEILQKCGFEFDTITFSKSYLLLAEGDNGFDVWVGGLSKVKLNPIKHLHQLQNLYFALTSEELTYNP